MSRTNNDTLIVAPVSVHDVAKVIHMGSLDVGTLCSDNNKGNSGYVNKWAKYKPVRYANLIDTTDQLNANNTWKSTATWWKAGDGKCGFTIDLRTTGSGLVTNWGTDWAYNPPTGGLTAPYRLTDFNYYDHKAVSPVYVSYPSQFVKGQGNDLIVMFNSFYGNDNRLLLTDVTQGIWGTNKQMYCGVLLAAGVPNSNYTNRTKIAVVNPTPLGSGTTDHEKYDRAVSVPYDKLKNFNLGVEIMIYPFLCQNAYSYSEKGANEDVSWTYGVVACPTDMATIYVVQAWISGALSNVTCAYGQGGNSVQLAFSYVITGHNGFSEDNLTAFLYVLDNDIDTSGQYPDSEKKDGHHIIEASGRNPFQGQSFGSITLADGETMSFTQKTLMNDTTGNFVAGIDAASYVAQYRAKYGSTATPKVTIVIEFKDNNGATYGQATVSDVSIAGV